MSVLALGTVALDHVETPHGVREGVIGGSGTYFAWAAATFAPTHLVAAVGGDFPAAHRELLVSRGIGLAGLEQVAGAKTFTWRGRYGPGEADAKDEIQLNVLEHWVPSIPASLRNTPFVFVANDAPERQLHFLSQLSEPRLVLCDTRQLWIESDRRRVVEVMQQTDGIIVNESEARFLAEAEGIVQVVRRLHQLGSRIVIVKRGEYGAFLSIDGAWHVIPAFPVESAVDPTGAGDSFAGGLLGAMAHANATDHATLKGALRTATVTASFCVEQFSLGGMQTLSRTDVEERRQQFEQLLQV